MKTNTVTDTFAEDIRIGLTSKQKHLSSKYFYDEIGDQIFQKIMQMKEYYPTTSEYEVFSMQTEKIHQTFQKNNEPFNLIEFGAGDGYKTKVILKYLLKKNVNFKYVPIDISANVLQILSDDLEENLPALTVEPIEGEYFEALKKLNDYDQTKKVMLFLGSNIGNFKQEQSIKFLKELHSLSNPNDLLMIGFDLKKDPNVILNAYNDSAGITKAFNLNLLHRINKEYNANFNLNNFDHYPTYDPISGTTKSFLVSKVAQKVWIDALNLEVNFEAWEMIHTEISQKYDLSMINNLAQASGFEIEEKLYDCKHYYLDTIWKVN